MRITASDIKDVTCSGMFICPYQRKEIVINVEVASREENVRTQKKLKEKWRNLSQEELEKTPSALCNN